MGTPIGIKFRAYFVQFNNFLKKKPGKIAIFLKKALQKEVTIFFARIELAEFFFRQPNLYGVEK